VRGELVARIAILEGLEDVDEVKGWWYSLEHERIWNRLWVWHWSQNGGGGRENCSSWNHVFWKGRNDDRCARESMGLASARIIARGVIDKTVAKVVQAGTIE
jgi:hypothetical protein